ncbi:MAG: AAA family ATPase [Clostridia bacterium]|uniref:AAA family ATPase n=1 Tax=Hominilimicola sp. TaxID=3073571 RepID=UPI003994BD02
MFTYIELSNFKSFGNIRFDFRKNKKQYKKFIAIYGENGSGKSNFVSAIELLSHTVTSFVNIKHIKQLRMMLEKDEANKELLSEDWFKNIGFLDISQNLKNCRMIDNNDISTVTYGFLIDEVEGYYTFSFDDKTIVREELYYLNNKQRGKLFTIENKDSNIISYISQYLFKDKKYENDIMELSEMYWGKHSFLALILGEIKEKNKKYIATNISENLIKVIDGFMQIFISCKSSRYQTSITGGSNFKFRDFENVDIKLQNEKQKKELELIEKILKDFYTQAYTDIIDIYYEQVPTPGNNQIARYKLYGKKIIAGKTRVIPFSLESAGTQNVLSVLRAILEAINGQTVVYDEIDNGIHDLLMKNILISLKDEITGQLIITTHNTLLLEELDSKSAYVIYTDFDGNKDARCFDDYDIRIQSTNNARKLYLNGIFGGIPYNSEIDYSKMHIEKNNLEE